jgi:hypothetical protein
VSDGRHFITPKGLAPLKVGDQQAREGLDKLRADRGGQGLRGRRGAFHLIGCPSACRRAASQASTSAST